MSKYDASKEARAYYREYARNWRKNNLERSRASAKRHYEKNRDKIIEQQRSWRARRTEGYLLSAARRRAKSRGIPFNLSVDDICIPERCPVLGLPIDRNAAKWADNTPSLDRVDPRKGYVKGNVRVISRRANLLKNDATTDELWNLYLYSAGML